MTNTQFEFENKLMQEHFNEKYIESEKYPQSSFKGKINETIDYTKDGEHNVTVTGKLNIHGVEQDRTISGKVIIKNGTIQLISEFKVRNVDHNIQIPKLVVAKIAEAIEVKVDCILMPKK
jgi:polyisoprenoid-binding protein YceI